MLAKSSSFKVDLLNMMENILTCWAKNLKKDVLRGLLVGLFEDLSAEQKTSMYLVFVEMGIYNYVEVKLFIFVNIINYYVSFRFRGTNLVSLYIKICACKKFA